MKNPLSIILILVGLGLAVYGISELGDSGASVEIGDLELSARDDGKETQSYILIGLGVVALIGGVALTRKK